MNYIKLYASFDIHINLINRHLNILIKRSNITPNKYNNYLFPNKEKYTLDDITIISFITNILRLLTIMKY